MEIGVPVQGVVSPIHIYVDTVLASGSTGALAPRFNGCAIQNEYLIGQTIVFRVYANNADQGGAVMDTTNTSKALTRLFHALARRLHFMVRRWCVSLK